MELWRWSSHTSWESVLSRSMDSATSPSAPRRMTGLRGLLRKVKVFMLEKPSIKESDAMRIGCWCRTHWLLMLCALMLRSLVVETVCVGCWGSVNWLLLLSALMLMLSALMLILHSLDADALCIAWRCSVHWLLILCALILLSAYWCWCCLK